MNDDLDRSELQRLRLGPLNQVASLKLKEAGVSDHPTVMPVFRLMEWELATGSPPPSLKIARQLLQLRQQRDQRAALDYLLANLPEGLSTLQRRLLRLPPHDAARALLDILDMRLKSDPKTPYPEA